MGSGLGLGLGLRLGLGLDQALVGGLACRKAAQYHRDARLRQPESAVLAEGGPPVRVELTLTLTLALTLTLTLP